ncbi:MAG: hypothetical protein ACYCSO_07375 [Cuniculiplasma sp.]
MPIISSSGSVKVALSMIRKMKNGYEMEFKTFKKDRGFTISKSGDGELAIKEFGFLNSMTKINENEIDRIIKTAFEREFPRSHEVRYSTRQIK